MLVMTYLSPEDIPANLRAIVAPADTPAPVQATAAPTPKQLTRPTTVVCNYLNTSSEWQSIDNGIYSVDLADSGIPSSAGSLANIKLYYITEDGVYSYLMGASGRYAESGPWGNTCEVLMNRNSYGYVKPMEEADIGICFNPPAVVRSSTDGILAITFEFLNGATPHVVYLRGEH